MKDFKEIESKWQKKWEENEGLYEAIDPSTSLRMTKPKKYVLVEFPYPSGSGLHMGHAFSFTGGDIYARYLRMKGENVMFPMGWDAFGLPTENYAIKTKRKPQEVTRENTTRFKEQMKRLAFSFDWSREVNTTDSDYYKWTQWIFVQLFKKGLAYKKEMPINWCPSCKIGLANEEVVDGKCERCGMEVGKRNISQWVVKITDYADKLLEGLEKTDFVEKVKKAQINWIGKSEGAKVRFKIKDLGESLEVFTTRPDTLYGATFMVVAPEHPLIEAITNNQISSISNKVKEEIEKYVDGAKRKSDLERTDLAREKTGVDTGLKAINPANDKEISIWVSDFVLAGYGTGAIMSVPGHDERDKDFAKKYGLPIVEVVEQPSPRDIRKEDCFSGEGIAVKSGNPGEPNGLNGLFTPKAKEKIIKWLEKRKIGEKASSYHLRDWIFSRQHYWGEPIPMIFCAECAKNHNFQTNSNVQIMNDQKEKVKKLKQYAKENNIDHKILLDNPGWYPVPEEDLPVVLPEVEAYEPTDTGESPLAKIEEFVKCKCPKCGGEARRETDTMPNWAGSDWYFLRYTDPKNDTELASMEKMKYWMPVDVYVGGDEHNTLHLLYSRFIINFLYDIGVVPVAEPYYKRLSHGVILGTDNQRMSKSRGNVLVPDEMCDKYGVDVVRMYLMFMGPFEATMAWSENTVMGVKRFLDRWEKYVVKQIDRYGDGVVGKQDGSKIASSREMKVIINKMVARIGEDIGRFSFNTAVAGLMESLNSLEGLGEVEMEKDDLKKMIKVIAPLAPYVAEEMWARLYQDQEGQVSVHVSSWPEVDEKYLKDEKMEIPIAINGKKRSQIEIDAGEVDDKKKILELAKNDEGIKKWIEGKNIDREIYVPGKMVNLVVRE